MALKSSREGLRKELVDYLGNIIIDDNLRQNVINSIDDYFINKNEIETIIADGVLQVNLLWTNASPISTFASQTINLDLNNYNFAYIIVKRNIGDDSLKGSSLIQIGASGQIFFASVNKIGFRNVLSVEKTGINFSNGVYDGSDNDDYGIPLYIFGVK